MPRKCIDCGKDFDRSSGPMICMCTECLRKPPPPDPHIQVNGIWVPNPEVAKTDVGS
jgi:hypothetical protein